MTRPAACQSNREACQFARFNISNEGLSTWPKSRHLGNLTAKPDFAISLFPIGGYSATCQDDVDRLNERIAQLATIDPISRSRAMVKSALTISLYLFSLCL